MKKVIKINESKLRELVKETIKSTLKEAQRHEIFTLNIFDIDNEESIDDMRYAHNYDSADEAIQAAREVAQKYSDMDSVVNVFVMAGEYMDEQGNVFGEPDAIYCISNKDEQSTMQARKNAGYNRLETDEYTDNVRSETKLSDIIAESIKKALKERFEKPKNWKDTPFKGTYQDEDGSIYMPDDDIEDEENQF